MGRVEDMARLRREINEARAEAKRDMLERQRVMAGVRQEAAARRRDVAKLLQSHHKTRVEVARQTLAHSRKGKAEAVSYVQRLKQEMAKKRRDYVAENEAARRAWLGQVPAPRRDEPRRRR